MDITATDEHAKPGQTSPVSESKSAPPWIHFEMEAWQWEIAKKSVIHDLHYRRLFVTLEVFKSDGPLSFRTIK